MEIPNKKEMTNKMLNQLRHFDKDRADYDELVELSAFARGLRAEYEVLGSEAPDWVDQQIKALRREIHARQQDALEMRLAKAKARRGSLATTEEKRAQLDEEIKSLEAKAKGVQP
jgi:uncharacterized protein (DUF3084 family)